MSIAPLLRLQWETATKGYEEETGINVQKHPLAHCGAPDAVLTALDVKLTKYKAYHAKKEKLHGLLEPILHLIDSLSGIVKEAVGVAIPFAQTEFVALGKLVQAAKDDDAHYDHIIDLCERLHPFLEHLQNMSMQQLDGMLLIITQVLAHLLSIFGLARKEMKQSSLGSFLQHQLRKPKPQPEDALRRLDKLIQDTSKKLEKLNPAEQLMSANQSTNSSLELWEAVWKKYEQVMKVNVQTHPLATPQAVLDTLDHTLRSLQVRYTKKAELHECLGKMFGLIGSLSGIAGEAVAVPVPYAKAGFVALGVLVQAAKDVNARYDCIIELCKLLHSFLNRLQIYMSMRVNDGMQQIVIQIFDLLLSVFGLVTKEMESGLISSYWGALIGKTEIQDALKKLDKLIHEEQSMGIASTMQTSQKILDQVHVLLLVNKQLQNDVGKAIQSIKELDQLVVEQLNNIQASITHHSHQTEQLIQHQLDKDVRDWLNVPDATEHHNTARDLHESNTGSWLLESPEYKSWKSSTVSSLFWLHGKLIVLISWSWENNYMTTSNHPISSTIIEDLKATPGSALAYFYFKYSDKAQDALRGMLSSVISQLAKYWDFKDQSPLHALHKECDGRQPSLSELTGVLKQLVQALSRHPIFIVLDALDESPKPNELGPLFRDLLQSAGNQVYVFVTSRVESRTAFLLPMATFPLDLSSVIKGDVFVYLKAVLATEEAFKSPRWTQEERDLVLNYLVDHSDGMFQWVVFQKDELSKCSPQQDLQGTLDGLPRDLPATYVRILSRISELSKHNERCAYHLFNWLAYSLRPLHLNELAQVLAVDFATNSSATFQEGWIPRDFREDISRICLSLVHITPDGIVQFAHFSVKEFLISKDLETLSSSELRAFSPFKIEAEIAHTIIATSCLAYLLWLGNLEAARSNMVEINRQYPLAKYSSQNAVPHAQFGHVCDNVLAMLQSLFIEDSPQWVFWVSRHSESFGPIKGTTGPPLYWAAKSGFLPLVLHLMGNNDEYVNKEGGLYGNALQAASIKGHLDIVTVLLDHGAKIDMYCGLHGSVLQAASVGGHLDIAQLLLEKGAKINLPVGSFGDITLQAAAVIGHLALTKLLLDYGANPNIHGESGGTALQEAAGMGNMEIVELLLNYNADINARGSGYGTALQIAAFTGRLEVVQFLLAQESGAGSAQMALQAAALGGWLDVVQSIASGVQDINAGDADPEWPTALQAALYCGNTKIAQLLLDREVKTTPHNLQWPSPLQAALYGGHAQIAQKLLDKDAELNAQDGGYPSALQSAVYGGHLNIVKVLLNKGARDEQSLIAHFGSTLSNNLQTTQDNAQGNVPTQRTEQPNPHKRKRLNTRTFIDMQGKEDWHVGPFPVPLGDGGEGGAGDPGRPGGAGINGGWGGRGGCMVPGTSGSGGGNAWCARNKFFETRSLHGAIGGDGGCSDAFGGRGGDGRAPPLRLWFVACAPVRGMAVLSPFFVVRLELQIEVQGATGSSMWHSNGSQKYTVNFPEPVTSVVFNYIHLSFRSLKPQGPVFYLDGIYWQHFLSRAEVVH
ncbi:hypothetical protein C8R46DRAFT_1201582 [Mycena filopes]|nr:hypothetical protein C8R46DRAFT_1201582 [Mycena filopes]